jgi:uncharacterized membrane protein YccC
LEPRPFIDPAFRFSIKLGAAITLALLVGLTTQRADLQTILWSVVVAGLPNTYGAAARKTVLRLAGCVMGGLAALTAMLIVSQNFDSLAAYLAAIFAVTIFSTYVAHSSERLGYAGIRTGITFMIWYVALAPSSDITNRFFVACALAFLISLDLLDFAPDLAQLRAVRRACRPSTDYQRQDQDW